jgi:hypothetical protein
MTDLIARIEAAQGPSYELDCAIWDLIYPNERQARFDKLTAKGEPYHGRLGPADLDGYVKPLRSFTGSLDGALTLVPERWQLRQMHFNGPCADDRKWHLNLHGGKVGQDIFVGRGKTTALAFCAAALRAVKGASTPHPFAYCCAEAGGDVSACDCVSKNHGTALFSRGAS